MTTTRTYRGVSAPERKAARRERLLDAALDELGEHGVDATTMTSVCRRAGLTERYFYESFANLHELLQALFDRHSGEVLGAVQAAIDAAGDEPRFQARAAVGAVVNYLLADPRIARTYLEALGSEALRERRRLAIHRLAAMIEAVAGHRRGSAAGARVRIAAVIVAAGMAEAATDWLDGTLAIDAATFVEHCADVLVRAVFED